MPGSRSPVLVHAAMAVVHAHEGRARGPCTLRTKGQTMLISDAGDRFAFDKRELTGRGYTADHAARTCSQSVV